MMQDKPESSGVSSDKYTQQEWDKAIGWGKLPEDREFKPEPKKETDTTK